jgi:hypothetical protein
LAVLAAELAAQLLHSLACARIGGDASRRPPPSMEDRGVIASTEVSSDRGEGLAGELTGQIHRHLPWPCDPSGAGGGEELRGRESEVLARGRLDLAD